MRVSVGLVVNPAAARDVRRLTSLARTVEVHERVNIVARVLRGLAAVGVDDVHYMVEPCHVVERAWHALAGAPASAGRAPSLRPAGPGDPAVDAAGTAAVAAALREAGVACVVCIGGDGTHRAVTAGWPDVVLAPLPGGTNNAFAPAADPTVVGLAAGLYARDPRGLAAHVRSLPRLAVTLDGNPATGALVDVAVVDEAWVGAHAVWNPALLVEAVLARSDPTVSGLAAVGGMVCPLHDADRGLHIRFGADGTSGTEALAPLGPGQLGVVSIAAWAELAYGDEVVIAGGRQVTLAFDGEREVVLQPHQHARVLLDSAGPRLLDVEGLVWQAAGAGAFTQPRGRGYADNRGNTDTEDIEDTEKGGRDAAT